MRINQSKIINYRGRAKEWLKAKQRYNVTQQKCEG